MRCVLIVIFLGVFLTGCGSTNRGGLEFKRNEMPEWSRTGVHPDYPQTEYLVTYGLARTSREAHEIATSRLEAVICDHAVSAHRTLLKDTLFEQAVTRPAAWFSLPEFTDAIRSDVAGNGFEAVAMRAIKRTELQLRARSLLATANRELADAMEPPTGLGSIDKRLQMWGDYFVLAMRVVALELLASETLNRTAFDKVERALMAIWELPTLIRTDLQGGEQPVHINGGAHDPLILKASFRGQPVTGVPIAWGASAGFKGVVEGDKELDAAGQARGKVLYLAPTGDDFGYVQACIDIDAAVGRRTGITMNVWLWRMKLPCRKNGELVLRMSETRAGDQPLDQPVFAPEVKKWAEGRAMAFTEDKPNARYQYHLLLEGQVDVTTSMRDEIPSAYVTGTATLSNLDTGEVIYRYSIGLQRVGERGNSEATVAALALREGAGEVMAEFASRIINALPAPGDEFGR